MITLPAETPHRLPAHAWVGALILLGAEAALAAGSRLVATWFTPIQWTGYILLADGLVFRLTGASWLMRRRREFPLLVLASVGVWLLFEAYNLHLQNWIYAGVPRLPIVRDLAYFWSFATIMPGVFETADLLAALLGRKSPTDPADRPPERGWKAVGWTALGAPMVALPLLLPAEAAAYLFGLIWLGFIPLLEPINARLGAATLWANWRAGRRSPVLLLLLAGLLCGFLWETWNYQAFVAGGAFWVYTVPAPLRIFGWRFGQMPVLGLLGFPPFALELYAFYALIRKCLGGDHVFGAH
jgi:hypothetical protein